MVSSVALVWYFNAWRILAIYWIAPLLTVLIALLYLRDIAEHFALPGEGIYASRSWLPSAIEGWFLSPHNVGFHGEHHLFPGVPWCHLPQLHHTLMQMPAYERQAVVTQGYSMAILREASHMPAIDMEYL